MKRLILFLLGLTPLALGFWMNSWMMNNPNNMLPYKLIGIVFLVFWFVIGFKTCKFEETTLKSAAIVNLPALLMVILLIFQELILGQYWMNLFGTITQFYYLPLVNISASIEGIFGFFIPGLVIHMWSTFLIGFFLMLASYYLGSHFKRWTDM